MLELNFNKLVVVHKELFKDELVSLKASSISGVVFETHAAGMNFLPQYPLGIKKGFKIQPAG